MGGPGEAPATSPQSTGGSSSLYESTGSRLTSPTSPGRRPERGCVCRGAMSGTAVLCACNLC